MMFIQMKMLCVLIGDEVYMGLPFFFVVMSLIPALYKKGARLRVALRYGV
jgi:hypothetical protein